MGVRCQLAHCERRAALEGWEVVEHFVDDDVSAYNGRVRPAYRRMLEEIRGGFLDAVVVWHADRLHRQPKELEEFIDVCAAAGVTRFASLYGDIDLGTADGLFMARILGAGRGRRAMTRAVGSAASIRSWRRRGSWPAVVPVRLALSPTG